MARADTNKDGLVSAPESFAANQRRQSRQPSPAPQAKAQAK